MNTILQLQYDYTSFPNLSSLKEIEIKKGSEDYGQNLANLLSELKCNPYYIRSIMQSTFHANMNDKVFYHSPLHVLSILSFAQINGIALEDWELLAIYFHDAIYRPDGKKNEINSIQFMLALLSDTGISSTVLSKTANGIQATAMHLDEDVDPTVEKLLDLDIHIFSLPGAKYVEQSNNIRQEWVNEDPLFNGVTNIEFTKGRIQFLEKFSSKKSIFRTDFFKKSWETNARNNINMEIDILKEYLNKNI